MIGKILYAALFIVLLPLLLILWVSAVGVNIPALPGLYEPFSGTALGLTGLYFLFSGMLSLWREGKGLPMNAYPPPNYVRSGLYTRVAHPIYAGFCMVVTAISLLTGSAGGLWLISPLMVLACMALVFGYEKPDLQERFGDAYRKIRFFPAPDESVPTFAGRIAPAGFVFGLWLLLYELIAALPLSHHAISLQIPFERNIPVLEFSEFFYGGAYIFVIQTPFLLKRNISLRQFCCDGLIATLAGSFIFLIFPVYVPQKPLAASGFWAELLLLERSLDTPMNAFPSFHALWALIAASALGRDYPKGKFLFYSCATVICISCITTGMHVVADLAAAIALFLVIRKRSFIAGKILLWTEGIANSWHEWHIGRLRIINHSLYAGIASLFGMLLASALAGGLYNAEILFVALCSLTGAGLWAQLVEGSTSLQRPFGYYGSIAGGLFGTGLAALNGADPWLILASFAIAAPFIQALGRLRCLVQGCCHGAACKNSKGIIYRHPQSRVLRLSELGGQTLHATPLYSIAANLVAGVFLLALWRYEASPALIGGLYFILNGLSRFVEEAYRGEPQTRVILGLRFYQWTALVSLVLGAVLTAMPVDTVFPEPASRPSALAFSLIFAFTAAFAQGMDFPASQRRFSRLS